MKLFTNTFTSVLVVMLLSPLAWANTMTIPNTFVSGDPAVAADVNANFTAAKSAIDDNDSRITTNDSRITTNDSLITTNDSRITSLEGTAPNIAGNTNRIAALENPSTDLVSSIRVTVGRPNGYVSGNATFEFLLSNKTNTNCDVSTAFSTNQWRIGANTKGLILIFPTYTALSLPGYTTSGFPIFSTTYTIVARAGTVDFSANDYVEVTLSRSETNSSDTCSATDVMVRGVLVTFPDGNREFIPPSQLKIQ